VITPMNDSFVDFDVLGIVDPVSLRLIRPSHYAEEILAARSVRAGHGRDLDWVVLRNRLSGADNNNRQRVEKALYALSEDIGFRVGPSLRERVATGGGCRSGVPPAGGAARGKPGTSAGPKQVARDEVNALLDSLKLPQKGETPDRVRREPEPAPAMSGHL